MGEKGGAHTRLAKPENRLDISVAMSPLAMAAFLQANKNLILFILSGLTYLDFIFVTFGTVTHQKKAESLVALRLLFPRVGVCKNFGHL